jgi:hypothetical protein
MATATLPIKPHISNTQLDMYCRCPAQWEFRYAKGLIIPPGIALLQGTGFHRGAEGNLKQKIESHKDLPVKEIVDMAVSAFDIEMSGGYKLTDGEASVGAKKVLGEARDKLAEMAEIHATDQAPDYQPVAVEHKQLIVFPSASHDLLTVTDLRDTKKRVTDFKTAAKKKPVASIHSDLQLTIYAAAYKIDIGEMPSEVRQDIVTKTKSPARQLLQSERTVADFQALVYRVNSILSAIQAGIFPPCSPGSWNCGPKWCGYFRNECLYVNSERLAAAESNGE